MSDTRKFSEFSEISPGTLSVLTSLGFVQSTPVQDATIPLFCGNKDVAVDACTGSGKTLAFIVPVVEKLRRLEEKLKLHQVGAIIVSPTRELARQIFSVAGPLVASVPALHMQLLVGGTDISADVSAFKELGGHVLVGTPGRIDDIMKRCAIMDLKRLEVLVLDEADRLLDMGFKVQLDAIMARLPRQRRTGLFSATQTEAVQALSRAGLRNPVRINVAVNHAPKPSASKKAGTDKGQASGGSAEAAPAAQVTPSSLTIHYTVCETDEKLSHLVHFLQRHASEKMIVYFLTCSCVDFYQIALKKLKKSFLPDLQVFALHGRMKQAQRESTLEAYSKLPAGVLLCTDLASRGLDIPDVHWIVQLDPPQDPSAFVHRVGRTARMGRSGSAVVYLLPHESAYVDFLKVRKIPITEAESPDDLPANITDILRKEAEADREVLEAGTKAFVSFVRGYKEHHCKFIFRLQDLSLGRLATSLALLRLPGMPEVKKALRSGSLADFTPSEVNVEEVRFKDKAREKQRQSELKKRAAAKAEEEKEEGVRGKKASAATAHGKRAEKAAATAAAAAHHSGERLPAAKRRKLQEKDENEELEREYLLLKKLKRGKISNRQFDAATGLTDDDDDDDDLRATTGKKSSGKHAQSNDDSGDDDETAGDGDGGGGGGRWAKVSAATVSKKAKLTKKGSMGSSAAKGGAAEKAVAKLRELLAQGRPSQTAPKATLQGPGQLFGATALSGSNMSQYLMQKTLRRKKKKQKHGGQADA